MLDTMLRTTKHLIENPDEYGPIITKTETVGKLEETPDDSVVVEGWQVRNEYVRITVSWCCKRRERRESSRCVEGGQVV